MRILVMAHHCIGAGAASVAKSMVDALARNRPEHEYIVTCPKESGIHKVARNTPNCRTHAYPVQRRLTRWRWDRFNIPRLCRKIRPDVVLSLADRGLLDPPCPQAILVHRPQLFYPSKHYGNVKLLDKLLARYHKHHLARSLKQTDLLLCQTHVARDRMLGMYEFTGRSEICPNAVAPTAGYGSGDAQLHPAVERNRDKHLLFCLAQYYGHKNLEILVDLFVEHGHELEDVAIITTVTPEQHANAPGFLERIERAKLGEKIINVGRIPQQQLEAYYDACSGMILPTLLESFSGTYLESMYFGTPVLTSDLDFAHVVCDQAAAYFDPWDPASISRCIRRVVDDPDCAESLVVNGYERRKKFCRSWESIADELVDWLEQIAGEGKV